MSNALRMAAVATLLALTTGLTACGNDGESPGASMVTTSQRTWEDTSRRTPRTSNYAGADSRTLRTRLWVPEGSEALPLLIMAHGFGGSPEKFEAFARTLAAAGYLVAAPAFPLTNEQAPGGHDVGLRDFVNQPGDVSFVLSQLLAANQDPSDELHARLLPDAVAVLGHSLGGVTAIGLTRKQCCRDQRVRATILVAAVAPLTTGFGIDPISTGPPTLIVQGTDDPTVPYATGPELYAEIQPPRYLLGLRGAGHSEDLEDQSEPPIAVRSATQRAVRAFLDARFRGDEATWRAVRNQLQVQEHVVEADPD